VLTRVIAVDPSAAGCPAQHVLFKLTFLSQLVARSISMTRFAKVFGKSAQLVLTLLAGVAMVDRVQAAQTEWHMHTGGVSHHFQETKAAGRQWQEQHPGVGIERRVTYDDGWSLRASLGTMQDSRGFWGGYTGAAYLRSWTLPGRLEAGVGLGAYGFYRSTSWKGKMGMVPGVLPTASISIPSSNLGFNFLYVPRVGGYNDAMPSVLYAQMSLRFR
jgi:Antimicrobial peptide resistance and lipid A acylation protein PagP